jgi:microsomal dipeptidase-like Zn-dependent dipeptidase
MSNRSLIASAVVVTALAMVSRSVASGANPPDPKLLEKARAVQKRIIAFDSHVDIPFDYGSPGLEAGTDGKTQFDLPKVERGGLKGAALAIFVPQGPRTPAGLAEARRQAEKKYQIITGIAAKYPDRAALAFTPDDVRRIAGSGKFAIVESILNGYPIGTDISQLDDWYNKGVRIFGFVHQGNNDLADSSRPNVLASDKIGENGGLTIAGKKAVARLNELGVLIDVSQLSPKAFWDVMSLTKAPVAATHSCVRALADHPRNLGDDQLEALKKNGGVIQIVAYSSWVRTLPKEWQDKANAVRREYGLPTETPIQSFMPTTAPTGPPLSAEKYDEYSKRIHQVLLTDAPRATVAELVNAVDYAVKKIGVDHVGISSDFNHGGGVIGWDNEGEAINVTVELLRRGYSEQEIGKLWGGNFLRVWGEAQKLAKKTAP